MSLATSNGQVLSHTHTALKLAVIFGRCNDVDGDDYSHLIKHTHTHSSSSSSFQWDVLYTTHTCQSDKKTKKEKNWPLMRSGCLRWNSGSAAAVAAAAAAAVAPGSSTCGCNCYIRRKHNWPANSLAQSSKAAEQRHCPAQRRNEQTDGQYLCFGQSAHTLRSVRSGAQVKWRMRTRIGQPFFPCAGARPPLPAPLLQINDNELSSFQLGPSTCCRRRRRHC